MKQVFLAINLFCMLALISPPGTAKPSESRNDSGPSNATPTPSKTVVPPPKNSQTAAEPSVNLQLQREGKYNAELERERSLKRAREVESSQFLEIEGQLQRQRETRTREIERELDRTELKSVK